MSLDIYLKENAESEDSLYWANITHNLGKMAREVKFHINVWGNREYVTLYECLWHPEEITKQFKHAFNTASCLITPLTESLMHLHAMPEKYKEFEHVTWNYKEFEHITWGKYEDFIPFLEKLLLACIQFPGAIVVVSV